MRTSLFVDLLEFGELAADALFNLAISPISLERELRAASGSLR